MPHFDVNDATERFSSRALDYTKSRPAYPQNMLGVLEEVCGLTTATVVADIGAGTGILTRLFASNGNRVIAVEPNDDMRWAAAQQLREFPQVTLVKGQAEATTLLNASVDLITVGQAFHWFSPEPTRSEFVRIARSPGCLAVVWNDRSPGVTAFMDDFEAVLTVHGGDYRLHHSRGQIDEDVLTKFFAGTMVVRTFDNPQRLDLPSLQRLLHSISYTPPPGHPGHAPMMDQLQRVFDAHQQDGGVVMSYKTRLYCGRLARAMSGLP